MSFKLISKNNIGVVTTLILVILLSQSRVFDFLLNTYLGRLFLIIFILGISYCHKIFGVVSVLFIIVMFNHFNFTFMEGLQNISEDQKNSIKQKLTDIQATTNPTTTKPTTKLTSEDVKMLVTEKKEEKKGQLKALEGFNMIEREDRMLRGKQSNSVAVSNTRNQNDNIEPSDKSVFSGSFASV